MKLNKTIEEQWDYRIGDNIEYFDPTKSYEITGYRPIDKENGLDFNPDDFMQTVFYKDKYGVHCPYPPKTPGYSEFWSRELDRCKNGMKVGKYRITGDNYFFLNFYKLLIVEEKDKSSEGRDLSHPNFYAKHYEYFHYIELCQYLKKDVCALKARGVEACPPFK